MGGGDKRPEDSDDSNEYEDRKPDSVANQWDSFGEDGSPIGGSGNSGSEGPTTLSDYGGGANQSVDRVQQYAQQGNSGGGSGSSSGESTLSDFGGGSGGSDGDSDSDSEGSGSSTLSDFSGDGLSASRSLLALSGIGLAVGTEGAKGESVVDMSENASEQLYTEAYEEVNGKST